MARKSKNHRGKTVIPQKDSHVNEKQKPYIDRIEPGMQVEATEGDLGEEDVSKPKVDEVVEDGEGNVEKIVINKGVIFKKKLEVPADRIQVIDQEAQNGQLAGKVTIAASTEETKS